MSKEKAKHTMSAKDKKDTIIIFTIFAVALIVILIAVSFSVIRPLIEKANAAKGLYPGEHQYFEDVIFIADGPKQKVYVLEDNENGTKSEITLPMESVNLGQAIENLGADTVLYYFTYNDKKYIVNFSENMISYLGLRLENNTFLVSFSTFDKVFKVNLDNSSYENLLSDTYLGKSKDEYSKRASINKFTLTWGTNPVLSDDGKYVIFASNRVGIAAGTDANKDIFIKNLETGEEKMIFDHHYTPVRFVDENKMLFMYTPDDTTVSNIEFILYNAQTGESKKTLSVTKDALSKTNTSFPYLINKLDNDQILIKNAADPENQNITINVPGVSRIYNIFSNSDRSKSIIGYNLSGHSTSTKFFTLIDWETKTYKHIDIDYYQKGFLLKSCYFTNDDNIGVNVSDGSESYNYYTTLDNLKERSSEITSE